MFNIIIVGTGKAAYLHYLKYKKIGIQKIYFFDNNKNSKYIKNNNIYYSIKDLFCNKFNSKNTIVDICTPCSQFKQIINLFIDYGIKNFIVEKPFVVEKDYFKKNKDINIIMIENYKYSLITKYISNYINENKLEIKKIFINFSKDRREESISKRGIANDLLIPTNFEIEMPHEIYLANYFIKNGAKYYKKILLKDMLYNNVCLPKHGYGYIEYTQNNTEVVLESNLMVGPNKRDLQIICNDDTIINASYINYNKDFVRQSKGVIRINKIGKEKKIFFEEDDNMYYTLNDYLKNIFNENEIMKYKKEILEFSKDMSFYMNNYMYEYDK